VNVRCKRGTALILTALLAACGSGVPRGAKTAPPPATGKTVSVAFHIVATKKPSGAARKPKYVSLGTQSAAIAVSAPGLPATTTIINCALGSCDGSVDAPVATDTFTVKLYDDGNGQGNLLSAGATTQTIVQDQANSVNITFDGVPVKTTALVLDMPNPLIGTPATINLSVGAVDAAGFTIVGPGSYNPPIVLTLTDPSGATSLSTTTVTSPNDVVTLAYNGAAKVAATVTSAVQGHAADQTAVFEPANVSAEYMDPTPEGFPNDIVQGPDGAMWFTDGVSIGRITTAGAITKYTTVGNPGGSIIVGPDGALWFTEFGEKQYGRISPADGTVVEYALAVPPGGSFLTVTNLAFGPDGLLYLTNDGTNPGVYAVVPATGTVVKSYTFGSNPAGIVAGPDSNIWVGLTGSVARIGLVDGLGLVTTYTTNGKIVQLTAGADGNVWFTDDAGTIGNVTPAGAVREYAIPQYARSPYGHAYDIVTAPDGTYWFTYGHMTSFDNHSCRLGHSTATGAVTSYVIAECVTSALAFGPDHNIWLAESRRAKIGIFSSFDPPAR
jgi:virginiamycin B lyase